MGRDNWNTSHSRNLFWGASTGSATPIVQYEAKSYVSERLDTSALYSALQLCDALASSVTGMALTWDGSAYEEHLSGAGSLQRFDGLSK